MMLPRRRSRLRVASAAAAGAACFLLGASRVGANDALNVDVVAAFEFAGEQLEYLASNVLTVMGVFTDYTDTDGAWVTEKENGESLSLAVWTSGMVAGMFWYQYEGTGEAIWKTHAEFYLEGLEGVETTNDNDLGFQVLNSFGLGWRLANTTADKDAYAERVLAGAETLYEERWDVNIPAFWSWDEPTLRPDWKRAVNVDMMMNMEIMLWASVNGGAESYADDVVGHADTTWTDIVRDDNSTFHVADYDLDTGVLSDQGTYQGWTNDSTWSRGQAWAVYGYVMIYRYLPEPRFLDRSIGLLGYWEDNLPDDLVPPSDFDAPVNATVNGKDSSATAIVGSALIELFLVTENPTYLVKAQSYLTALLSADYYLPDATDGWQSILRRATARWGDPEVGAVFGDYFLLETMVRYKRLAPSILLWKEDEVEVTSPTSLERKLQTLSGGEFCALAVLEDGTIAFEDATCIPVAPGLTEVEEGTPSPTPAPSSVPREVATLSPDAAPSATLSPVATATPTAADSSSSSTASPEVAPSADATLNPAAPPSATLAPVGQPTPSPTAADTASATLLPLIKTPTPVIATDEPNTPTPVAPPTPMPTPVPAAPPTSVPTPAATKAVTLAPAPVPMPTPVPAAPPTSVPTPAATKAVTLAPAPVPVPAPVQAPAAEPVRSMAEASGGEAVFGVAALDNDVNLSFLDPTSDVLVWLSITLSSTASTPSAVVVESDAGDVVEGTITAPAAGWASGENRVSFTLPTEALVGGTWETVVSVSVVLEASAEATTETTTTVTVNWLVVSNELVL